MKFGADDKMGKVQRVKGTRKEGVLEAKTKG